MSGGTGTIAARATRSPAKESSPPEAPRIAVIAVHGVADQEAGASANAIASLLGRLRDGGRFAYSPFVEEPVSIPTSALELASGAEHAQHDAGDREAERQLEGYTHDDAPYETTRRLGERVVGERATHAVDVYELYWADLSRVAGGVVRILGELYQLIFHLPELGTIALGGALYAAREQRRPDATMLALTLALHRAATALLTVVVPMVNLGLFVAAAAGTPAAIPESLAGRGTVDIRGWLFVAGALVVLTLAWLGAAQVVRGKIFVSVSGVAAFLAGAALVLWVAMGAEWPRDMHHLSLLAAALAAGGLFPTVLAHSRRAGSAAIAVYAATAAIALFVVWQECEGAADGREAAVFAALRSAEWTLAALHVIWVLTLVVALLCIASGFVAWLLVWGADRHGTAWRSVWRTLATGRLSLVASISLFLVVTLGVGSGFETAADTALPLGDVHYTPVIPWLGGPAFADEVLDRMRDASATPIGTPIALMLALALVVLGVPLLPNALAEIFPPAAHKRNYAYGLTLAKWGVRGAEIVLVLAMFGLVLGAALNFVPGLDLSRYGVPPVAETLSLVGVLLVGSATGLLAFRGRLSALTLGFRALIDVALDIDNYFRVRPPAERFRASVCARFASLLRFLHAERYDAIVIVAHSQGTVITADLLRYLERTGLRDAYGVRRVVLFTMGSPLRQLYAARFPERYGWAKSPEPTELGVLKWVNAFRRGDYVGGALWNDALVDDPLTAETSFDRGAPPVPTYDAPPLRRELCIGDGAHTHYWDAHGAAIVRELDVLIGEL